MDSKWALAYSTTAEYQAMMVKDMLEDNGIDAVIFNKKDSAYTFIGEVEIYVSQDNVIRARHLIKKLFESGNPD
jgi:hypothetical protein